MEMKANQKVNQMEYHIAHARQKHLKTNKQYNIFLKR
jgi:hypothetical protein